MAIEFSLTNVLFSHQTSVHYFLKMLVAQQNWRRKGVGDGVSDPIGARRSPLTAEIVSASSLALRRFVFHFPVAERCLKGPATNLHQSTDVFQIDGDFGDQVPPD